MKRSSYISSFKSVYIKILLVVIITFFSINVFVEFIARYTDSNYNSMKDLVKEEYVKKNQVLLVGDSRAHQGLVPHVFDETMNNGLTSVNLGRPGMQSPFTYFVSKKFAEKSDDPKFIVVNFSFYLLGGTQWMKNIYFPYYKPTLWEASDACMNYVLRCSEAVKWYVKTRVPIIKFRKRFNNIVRKNLPLGHAKNRREFAGIMKTEEFGDFSTSKGYLNRGLKHIKEAPYNKKSYKKGVERGYSNYISYIRRLFDYANSKNIEVIVYRFPWPESYNNPEFIEISDYYWDLIKTNESKNDNIHFIDDLLFWELDNFADPLHLNHRGAIKLSKKLATHINSHMPDNTLDRHSPSKLIQR